MNPNRQTGTNASGASGIQGGGGGGAVVQTPSTVSLVNDNAGSIVRGQAVYITAAGHCDLARSDSTQAKATCIGVVQSATTASGGSATVVLSGLVDTLTGIVNGATYWLSATPGTLATSPDLTATHYRTQVAQGLSATQQSVQIQPPYLN